VPLGLRPLAVQHRDLPLGVGQLALALGHAPGHGAGFVLGLLRPPLRGRELVVEGGHAFLRVPRVALEVGRLDLGLGGIALQCGRALPHRLGPLLDRGR
jgi:hypothetical protein